MLAAQCITWGKAALTNLHLKHGRQMSRRGRRHSLAVTLVWSGGHLSEMARVQIVYFEPKLSQISGENVIKIRQQQLCYEVPCRLP